MTGYILDCCTLLNLHCGWGGLHNLSRVGGEFHVGSKVASEAIFVREYGSTGGLIRRKLDFAELHRQCRIATLKLASQQEMALMVRLASWMDDGEAEGLAMAVCRGLSFCTDDGAVYKLVVAERMQVRLLSTPEIFQAWAGDDAKRQATLPKAVRRAFDLAKFRPHRSSPQQGWWDELLATSLCRGLETGL